MRIADYTPVTTHKMTVMEILEDEELLNVYDLDKVQLSKKVKSEKKKAKKKRVAEKKERVRRQKVKRRKQRRKRKNVLGAISKSIRLQIDKGEN